MKTYKILKSCNVTIETITGAEQLHLTSGSKFKIFGLVIKQPNGSNIKDTYIAEYNGERYSVYFNEDELLESQTMREINSVDKLINYFAKEDELIEKHNKEREALKDLENIVAQDFSFCRLIPGMIFKMYGRNHKVVNVGLKVALLDIELNRVEPIGVDNLFEFYDTYREHIQEFINEEDYL